MENFTAANAANALRLLADAAVDREDELGQYESEPIHNDSDEECDSRSPITDLFYEKGGNQAIVQMSNFNRQELDGIYDIISDHVSTHYNVGRGRKSPFTAKDMLFMVLTVLKCGGQWDFMARVFQQKAPSFERQVGKFIDVMCGYLYEELVEGAAKRYSMKKLEAMNTTFGNFPQARYATDVTFQQSYRPSGNIQEGKLYFSGKHKLYGYKVEVSVLPNGLAIGCSKHYPGSVSDFDIFRKMLTFHEAQLVKPADDLEVEDPEPGHETWALLCDKGYQGIKEICRAIHPKKKPANGILSIAEEQENKSISSDRILVENYFGRMVCLWNILSTKWKWNESNYDKFFKICLALTNYHIRMYKLHVRDSKHYCRVKNRLYSIGEDIVAKRRRTQAKYRAKRARRMEAHFEGSGGSSIGRRVTPPTALRSRFHADTPYPESQPDFEFEQ